MTYGYIRFGLSQVQCGALGGGRFPDRPRRHNVRPLGAAAWSARVLRLAAGDRQAVCLPEQHWRQVRPPQSNSEDSASEGDRFPPSSRCLIVPSPLAPTRRLSAHCLPPQSRERNPACSTVATTLSRRLCARTTCCMVPTSPCHGRSSAAVQSKFSSQKYWLHSEPVGLEHVFTAAEAQVDFLLET